MVKNVIKQKEIYSSINAHIFFVLNIEFTRPAKLENTKKINNIINGTK